MSALRRRARTVVHGALKRTAAVADVVRRPDAGAVVLIYHRVGRRSAIEVDLDRARFDDQMAALAASGRACTLDTALERVAAPTSSGPDPVVVTFDDGTADFVDEAVPILVRHGVPALLYVATEFVEHGRSFPDDGVAASWSALADAVSTGLVTIGSHTHSHALLDRLDPALVAGELDSSIGLIADRLGVEARHFAYPKALAGSAAADREVRSRFASAALAGTRPNPYGHTDPYRLQRSPIQHADGMRWFARKVDGGMHLEDDLRRFVNRARYAGATT